MSSLADSHVEAVAIDVVFSGNEDRLLFAWPIVAAADGTLAAPEGAFPITTRTAKDIDVETVDFLRSPVFIKPDEGLLVVGPRYFELAKVLPEPYHDLSSIMTHETRSGFRCVPISVDAFGKLAHALSNVAIQVFDRAVTDVRGARMTPKARAALRLFDGYPSLPYESRVLRRLVAHRIDRRGEAYLVAFGTACDRLELTPAELQTRVEMFFEVLAEARPFEAAIVERAARHLSERLDSISVVATARVGGAQQDAWNIDPVSNGGMSPTIIMSDLSRWLVNDSDNLMFQQIGIRGLGFSPKEDLV